MSLPPGQGPPPFPPEFLAEDCRDGPRIGIWASLGVAIFVIGLRVYVRLSFSKNFGLDDALIVIAGAFMVATAVLCIKILDYGAGLHIYAIPPPTLVLMLKHLVAVQLIYTAGLWVCRISGLAFYARLCKDVAHFKIYMWCAFAFVTAVFIAQFLILALQCIPLKALWHDGPGTCMSIKFTFISTAASTIVCDSIVLLIPVRIVWGLNMTRRRKVLLLMVLLVGVFAVATSIFRINSMLPAIRHEDVTWYYANIAVWTCAEVCAAIVALSAPALKPLFGTWLRGESLNGSKGMNSYDNRNGTGGIAGKGSKDPTYSGSYAMKSEGLGRTGKLSVRNDSEEHLWSRQGPNTHGQVHVYGGGHHGRYDVGPNSSQGAGISKTVEVTVV